MLKGHLLMLNCMKRRDQIKSEKDDTMLSPPAEIGTVIYSHAKTEWKRRCASSLKERHPYGIEPSIKNPNIEKPSERLASPSSWYCGLGANVNILWNMLKNVAQYFLHCPAYENQRTVMAESLELWIVMSLSGPYVLGILFAVKFKM